MKVISVNNNIMNSVSYVLYDEKVDYCVMIDCGEYDTLKPVLNSIKKNVRAVLLTHGHSDHILGLGRLVQDFPDVSIYSNEYGHKELSNSKLNFSFYCSYPFELHHYKRMDLSDKQKLYFDGVGTISVFHTPGHDESCLSYLIERTLFTGDSYLPGIKTITTFKGGNKAKAAESCLLLSEYERQGYIIMCGHHSYHKK